MSTAVERESMPMQALAIANEVKHRRIEAREEIKALDRPAGRARLAMFLLECPDWLRAAPVDRVLSWLPNAGPHQIVPGLLIAADIHTENRPVGMLTDRQRVMLAVALTRRNHPGGVE